MSNVTKIDALRRKLYAAEGNRGTPLPKAIIDFIVSLQAENPNLEISFGGEKTMDFFRSTKAEKFVFLDTNAHRFEFAENPPARSRNFFAIEQTENTIILFARFC